MRREQPLQDKKKKKKKILPECSHGPFAPRCFVNV